MIRISTIRYEYRLRDYYDDAPMDKGMVEFTIVGDDVNKYYMKVDANSRHDILNIKNWDYSELSELYIDYAIYGNDTPVEIDTNHIIKLPIKKLYLNEVRLKGPIVTLEIECGKVCDKYVWDDVLMNLPTLRDMTIVGDEDIIYSLDFTHNPCLERVKLINMDIRDIKGYDTQTDLYLSLVYCKISDELAMELTKTMVDRMRSDIKDGFTLEFATEW